MGLTRNTARTTKGLARGAILGGLVWVFVLLQPGPGDAAPSLRLDVRNPSPTSVTLKLTCSDQLCSALVSGTFLITPSTTSDDGSTSSFDVTAPPVVLRNRRPGPLVPLELVPSTRKTAIDQAIGDGDTVTLALTVRVKGTSGSTTLRRTIDISR